jgi:hypothetical protein
MKIWLPAATFAVILRNHAAIASSEALISPTPPTPPFVEGKMFINGVVRDVAASSSSSSSDIQLADVYGCCASASPSSDECPEDIVVPTRVRIGTMPQMTSDHALQALQSAIAAWDGGSGAWPQTSLSGRIAAVQKFMAELKSKREVIVVTLMYEIGKNRLDVSGLSCTNGSRLLFPQSRECP